MRRIAVDFPLPIFPVTITFIGFHLPQRRKIIRKFRIVARLQATKQLRAADRRVGAVIKREKALCLLHRPERLPQLERKALALKRDAALTQKNLRLLRDAVLRRRRPHGEQAGALPALHNHDRFAAKPRRNGQDLLHSAEIAENHGVEPLLECKNIRAACPQIMRKRPRAQRFNRRGRAVDRRDGFAVGRKRKRQIAHAAARVADVGIRRQMRRDVRCQPLVIVTAGRRVAHKAHGVRRPVLHHRVSARHWISSAAMLMAISAGVCAGSGMPMGECTLRIASSEMPSARSSSCVRAILWREPMQPT